MRPVLSRTFYALALVGLLLVAPLLATPAAAQMVRMSYGADEFTYGWTFPEAGDHPGATLEDPAGDLVASTDAGDVPAGDLPTRQGIDLVSLRIDEPDREIIRLTLQVGDLDPKNFVGDNIFGTTAFDFEFKIAGASYTIRSWLAPACAEETIDGMCESFTSPAVVLQALFYEAVPGDLQPVGYLPTRVLMDEDRIELLLPRWALDREGAGKAPLAGDTVTDVVVRSSGTGFCITSGMGCLRLRDQLPDAGPATDVHAIVLDSNGARLRFEDGRGAVEVEDNFWRWLPLTPRIMHMEVAPGTLGQVPVRVLNAIGPKALVLPTVEVLSDQNVPVHVPKSIEVPSGETRKLLVSINGTDALSVTDPLIVRLDLQTVGPEPAYDTVTLVIRSVAPLSDARPRLYLHTHSENGQSLFSDTGLDYEEAILNTLEEDPLDTGTGVVANDYCFCVNRPYSWHTQTGIPNTLHLDNDSAAELRLALDAPVAGTLMVQPIFLYGDLLVAAGNSEVDIDQGANEVTVPLAIADEAALLEPSDATFRFELRSMFRPGGVLFGEFAGLVEQVNPVIKTQGATWIQLPIIDPAQRYAEATHMSLDLGIGADRVQYVNPGRGALWNVTILNHADEEDTIELATTVPDGWKATIQPGKRYTLGPGESITVGVRAVAPADANEGTTAKVLFEVRSALAQGAATGMSLTAVVTSGIDIAETHYAPDNATSARLAEKTTTKESPVPSLFVGVLLLVAFVEARRRGRC